MSCVNAYSSSKYMETLGGFDLSTINASTPNEIKLIIPKITQRDAYKFNVIGAKLVYVGNVEREKEIVLELGLQALNVEPEEPIQEGIETYEFEETIYEYTGDWVRSTTNPTKGVYSFTNANIDDGQTSSTIFTVSNLGNEGKNSNLYFDYVLSSELGYDFFRVYINDTKVLETSGEREGYFELPIIDGDNIIKFEYIKDNKFSNGEDGVFIDNVGITVESLPPPSITFVNSLTTDKVDFSITYPTIATSKKYSLDGNTWQDYITPETVDSGTNIYAKYYVLSGEESPIASLIVANYTDSEIETYETENTLYSYMGDWFRSTVHPIEGEYSYTNNDISHGKTTSTTFYIDVPNNSLKYNLYFDYYLESEGGYDGFKVLINNSQVLETTGTRTSYLEKPLLNGTNVIKIEYFKDSSVDKGLDSVFIDNLQFKKASLLAPKISFENGDIINTVDVTISYPINAILKSYSFDGEVWLEYTGELNVPTGTTVYGKYIYAIGEESPISSMLVQYKLPTAPIMSQQNGVNNTVDVTIDCYGAKAKEYSLDGTNWIKFDGVLNFDKIGTVQARYYNELGHVSEIGSLVLKYNIFSEIETYETENTLYNYSGAWFRSTAHPIDGEYSYTNNDIGGSQTSSTTFNINVPDDKLKYNLYFDYYLESESGYDGFRVLINDNQVYETTGKKTSYVEKALLNGTNIIKIEYFKDSSVDYGLDAVFIDNIQYRKSGLRAPVITYENGPEMQTVNVGIQHSDKSISKKYSLDGNTWLDYTGTITVPTDTTVYAKYYIALEEESPISSKLVKYVSMPAPKITQTDMPDNTVNVTLSCIGDYPLEYSYDQTTWHKYTGPININNITTIYGRYIKDNVHISLVSSLQVKYMFNPIAETYEDESTIYTYVGDWIRTSVDPITGNYGFTNKDINGNQISSTTFTMDVPDNGLKYNLYFDYSIESESDYDMLYVYINGEMVFETSGKRTSYVQKPLLVGTNTIKLEYDKDSSVDYGRDSVIIDNLCYKRSTLIAPNITYTNGPTMNTVDVTIDYPDIALVKQYSLDGSNWNNYTGVINVSDNTRVYGRYLIALNEISPVKSLVVRYAISAAPIIKQIDNVNGTVDVNIEYPDNALTKSYSTDGVNWSNYTGTLNFATGATVYAKYITNNGHNSLIATQLIKYMYGSQIDTFETLANIFNYTGDWIRTENSYITGSYAYRNRNIDDDEVSSTTFNMVVPDDGFNYYLYCDYKVSSEENYDKFKVYINNSLVHQDSGFNASYIDKPLLVGNNEIKFEFAKDRSYSEGQDAVFVDNIHYKRGPLIAPMINFVNGMVVNTVDVTIDYPSKALEKRYSLDGIVWNNYTGTINVTSGITVYCKYLIGLGEESTISSLVVTYN